MQNNNKEMPKVTDELYFIIDEKANSIELTEKGIDLISTSVEDASFFILPDVGSKIADIEKSGFDRSGRNLKLKMNFFRIIQLSRNVFIQ